MNYSEKLKSPNWQRKRLIIFERDGWKCTICSAENIQLHIHHKIYKKHTDPWDYEDHYLTTLCSVCHKNEHEQIIDTERRYEHLIIYEEQPIAFSSLECQLSALNKKLSDPNISEELTEEILSNIIFIQNQKRDLIDNT